MTARALDIFRQFRLGAGIVAAAVVMSGCVQTAQAEPPPATIEADFGGTLIVGITEPGAIDPSLVFEPAGELISRLVCEPLLQQDPTTGALLPGIIASWLVTDGGTRVTIRVRDDVIFHDGRRLTAADVANSLTRVANVDHASPHASYLANVLGYGEVHGDVAVDDEESRLRFAGIQLIDGKSFAMQLLRADAEFPSVFAEPFSAPVPEDAVVADPFSFVAHPQCAGPYRLTAPWRPGDKQIVVERFEDYYGGSSAYTGGGAGYPDEIVFRIYPDLEAIGVAFDNGQIHVGMASAEVVGRSHGADVVSAPNGTVEYIGLPVNVAPYDQIVFRQALALALNREDLVQRVYEGRRPVATTVLPPGVPDRDEALECGAPMGGDPVRAKQLFATLGINPTQATVSFAFNDEFLHPRLAQEATRQWRAVLGLTFEPLPLTWTDYLAEARGATGFSGAFRGSMRPDHPSAYAVVGPLASSDRFGTTNLTRLGSTATDLAMQDALEIDDPETRSMALRGLVQGLCDQAAIIPVAYGMNHYLIDRDRVGSARDLYAEPATGLPAVRELFLRSEQS